LRKAERSLRVQDRAKALRVNERALAWLASGGGTPPLLARAPWGSTILHRTLPRQDVTQSDAPPSFSPSLSFSLPPHLSSFLFIFIFRQERAGNPKRSETTGQEENKE
jgi:hypothetical protein